MSDAITRSPAEIDQDYARHALLLGDRLIKMQLMNAEIEQTRKKLMEIIKEKSQAQTPLPQATAPTHVE